MREPKGTDGVCKSNVPKLEGAGDSVGEEEQGGREEEQTSVGVARRSCMLRDDQNLGRGMSVKLTHHHEDSCLPIKDIDVVFWPRSILCNDES